MILKVRYKLKKLINLILKTDSFILIDINDHIVLIHDAVRPLVNVDLVDTLIKTALHYGVINFDLLINNFYLMLRILMNSFQF